MRTLFFALFAAVACLSAKAPAAGHDDALLRPMPEALEIRFALSAAPPALRGDATVYVLDPASGYRRVREGHDGIACLVERTPWEMRELRNDVYIPLCYDAAGDRSYLQAKRDTAALRAQGLDAAALAAEMEKRWADGGYRVPAGAGVSYMVAPVMRAVGPPDLQVHTMTMPHLMFYAPGVTDADIGAKPDLADKASLAWPFIARQGNDAQSYIIQMVGDAEKAAIVDGQRDLLRELCTYDKVLCLPSAGHH
ncbi:MAG TPA: hypothetical protein VFF71_01455 [Luteimonas sp.]|nr:hypothetical protein [Luteimonas sp.]